MPPVSMTYVKVALAVPVEGLFDYAWTDDDEPNLGAIVRVPFGRRQLTGVVLGIEAAPAVDPAKVKPIASVLSDIAPLDADTLELIRFCSNYYHHPIGEVALDVLPPAYRAGRTSPARAPMEIVVTAAGAAALTGGVLKRAPALKKLLTTLSSPDAGRDAPLSPRERHALRTLVGRGLVELVRPRARPSKLSSGLPAPPIVTLTAEQQSLLHALHAAHAGFSAWLLHGVTGSGKTEVYFRAMDTALVAGGQVLLLVPEIGLTPQLESRIRARFPGVSTVTLHSALAARERGEHWRAAQLGDARIVLGTRSAVFTPLPELSLIIVDEEHDASYKQMESMRYSGRDLAIYRARLRSVPVILGTATPSLESHLAALRGRYRMLRLTTRANGQPMPQVELVPTTPAMIDGLAPRVRAAIGDRIRRGEQILVFINRRGFAPVLICPACGFTPDCHRCTAHLVVHRVNARLACHQCGLAAPIPSTCPQCSNADLRAVGFGTQRIEASLSSAFPAARLVRVDRDTTRGRDRWQRLRDQVERREVDILLGTQLLSKGHDFPGVGLVCVLNADRSLFSTDFRATEQLFAQLMQVAGRTGRGSIAGEVLIQTAFPQHPLYRAVQRHDYDEFSKTLLEERKAAALPPFVYQAILRAEARAKGQALEFLNAAKQISDCFADDIAIFDPTNAIIERIRGFERAQLLVQSTSRKALHQFLARWIATLRAQGAASGVRWSLDVDPLEI
jgi:primosomal protein N' (replication factor Y)